MRIHFDTIADATAHAQAAADKRQMPWFVFYEGEDDRGKYAIGDDADALTYFAGQAPLEAIEPL